MKNKKIYIISIIKSIIIVLLLFSIFFHNSGIAKMIILPFIACGIFSVGKYICFLIDNKKLANIFSKLFIISFFVFWFGFLILWSYLVIKENNYITLLFTIPFWIAGIYIIRKFLLGVETKNLFKNSILKFNFKIIISFFLIIIILLTGVLCLFFGIRDTYKLNMLTKNYIITTGYFIDYEIYDANNKEATYKLTYLYEVNGIKYSISTNYGVGYVPEKNSIKELKYNPSNPQEAILVGTNNTNLLIYLGGFFILGAIAFILAALQSKGVFDKFKIDIIGLYFGFTFFIVGVGFILLQNGITSSFLETIKSLGFWIIIPILFIIVGIFLIVKCLFFNKLNFKNKIEKKN